MLCLYSSDLHGNPRIYQRLFAECARPEVGALLLGGDLSPLEPPVDVMIRRQREFWREVLWQGSAALAAAGKRVLLIPGNDDLAANDDVLRAGHAERVWELVDGEVAHLDRFDVVGCATVSLTPFLLKDREAHDLEPGEAARGSIGLDDPNAIYTARRARPPRVATLREELEGLYARVPRGRPTILLAHCPPRDTAIDVLYDGRKVGSRAVREAIERHAPVLGLHGHIHESPSMPGGSWIDRIGATIVVNPGSSHHDGERALLHLVSFDTDDVAGTIAYARL